MFFAVCFFNKSNGQAGLCPSNLDFELGDFTGWICQAGIVDPTGNIIISPTPPIPGQHTIITAATAGLDPYGGFSQICPNGSGFSVKLGNSGGNHQAEGLSYTYTIPSTLTTFSMLFHYAVVLQDPNHLSYEQPRFRARITDLTTGLPIPCVDFDFIASGSLPGFQPSPLGNGVVYKNWTPITINLNAYIGRTIRLEFITNDCVFTAHFGYAYVDVNTNCNGAITGNYICPGEPGITLTAPFGFQSYRWFDDITCLNVVGTGQTLTLNPAPSVGAVYPVEITPFPGYGCLDTLYAIVDVATAPPKSAGPDQIICQGQTVQVGLPPLIAHTYSWTPVNLVNIPTAANPFAGPVFGPTEIYLETTDILTGCSSLDTVIVSKTDVDTTVTSTGNVDFCVGKPGGSFSVNNSSTTVQWYEATSGLIGGANSLTYVPTVSGTYWAEMSQGGCLDSSGYHDYFIRPIPIVAFTPSNDSGCVGSTTLTFTNNSNPPDGAAMTHLWKFSDGITDINTDASRVFGQARTYNVKLITTTQFGCIDSTDQFVHIMPKGVPDFSWDSICIGRPVVFTNLSNENSTPQAWYSWNFGNGDPLSTMKDPLPVSYNIPPGKVDIILKMATLGCENDTQTVVKSVLVNKEVQGIRYPTVTVPQGAAHYLHVRDTVGPFYNWRPQIHLSSYNTQYTQFVASGNDVEYLIAISDIHTCVTTDTILMQVLKKPGFYLPTAFTPNNDGLNDIIRPYLVGMKGLKSFSIFNRTGQLIFFSKTYGEGWDGKFQGVDQTTGVFVWILEFYDANNKLVTEKGTLTLIR
ncbi:MAG TPA: PKD domain-containing protein [Chitinophagaceae bacterium]|nr:PKD domain-containing protein [Chitinophagaceae bacterium]